MLELINQYIENNKERYIRALAEYIARPSVSSDTVNTPICAEYINGVMKEMGIDSRVYRFEGQPLVYGELKSAVQGAKTVLFYGHYDVQPVEPLSEWLSPPFELSIRDGRMYGRGTADNKGQHMAHLFAAEAYLKTNVELPINVKFIFEGEEEAGSTHLSESMKKISENLSSDIVIVSDGAVHESGRPRTSFGNRGGFHIRINVETASHYSHSGDRGGVIPNAGWELARLLSSIMSENGNVLIEGFYDDLQAPTPYEEQMIDSLPFDKEELALAAGVEKIYLDKKDYFRNLMFRPWINVNSIYYGEPTSSKGVIPGRAYANLDVRMVKFNTAEKLFALIEKHVSKQNIRGKVKVEKIGMYAMRPSKTNPDNAIARRIVTALEKITGQRAVEYPVSPGTLPTYIWEDVLQTPFIQIPYGNPDEHNHAPNENLTIEAYMTGIKISAGIIDALK